MTDDKKIKGLNKSIEDLFGAPPLLEYEDPKTEASHEEMFALSQMYALRGFRNYLQNQLNLAIKSVALRSEDMSDIFMFKGRILTLKELLVVSKRSFENLQKVPKEKIKLEEYATTKD